MQTCLINCQYIIYTVGDNLLKPLKSFDVAQSFDSNISLFLIYSRQSHQFRCWVLKLQEPRNTYVCVWYLLLYLRWTYVVTYYGSIENIGKCIYWVHRFWVIEYDQLWNIEYTDFAVTFPKLWFVEMWQRFVLVVFEILVNLSVNSALLTLEIRIEVSINYIT